MPEYDYRIVVEHAPDPDKGFHDVTLEHIPQPPAIIRRHKNDLEDIWWRLEQTRKTLKRRGMNAEAYIERRELPEWEAVEESKRHV